jgi:hypothetical protein
MKMAGVLVLIVMLSLSLSLIVVCVQKKTEAIKDSLCLLKFFQMELT